MIKLVDANDQTAVRNLNNILNFHEEMINQRRPEEAVAKFCDPGYVQHNPLSSNGAEALGIFFAQTLKDRPLARWEAHRIMAVDDNVWLHSNFLNLFNDDPSDTGIAGVDIFRMNAAGKAVEHWDVLQLVGTRENSAPWIAPNLPRANPNGMF